MSHKVCGVHCHRWEERTVKRCQSWIAECSARVFASGRCNATKEIDACDCGGDAARCDFYPEVREEAWRAVRNDLIRRSDALAQFPLPGDEKLMTGYVINMNSVRLRLERVPAVEAEPQWISVAERLPLCGERVLITEGNAVFEAYLSISHKWVRNGIGWMENVTHWMPLPHPPARER